MVVDISTNSVELEKIKFIRINRGLSLLFSKKQNLIINKIINFEQLNKTESEVYSRVVKPKLNGIIDLYDLAKVLRDKI